MRLGLGKHWQLLVRLPDWLEAAALALLRKRWALRMMCLFVLSIVVRCLTLECIVCLIECSEPMPPALECAFYLLLGWPSDIPVL